MNREWTSINPQTGKLQHHVSPPSDPGPLQDDPSAEPDSAFDAVFGRDVARKAGEQYDRLTDVPAMNARRAQICADNIARGMSDSK